MKSNTYKWIIGCLVAIIIILISFLIVKENKIIAVSFSECLSLASTLSSLILSVIAMFYTYYSGRDTGKISAKIQYTIKEVNEQVQQVSEYTKKNAETLSRIKDGMQNVMDAVHASSEALNTIQQENISEQDKQFTIENIKKTQNSMLMFLNKMRGNE